MKDDLARRSRILSGRQARGIDFEQREERRILLTFLGPAALILLVVIVIPLLYSLFLSFHRYDLLRPVLGRVFIGLSNYAAALTDPAFWKAVGVTVGFTAMAVGVEITLGLGIAVLLNQPFRGRAAVRTLMLLPWALPAVVNGIMWLWILNPNYGALNGLLMQWGLIDQYHVWLGDPGQALVFMALADAWKETPFIALLLLAGLQAVPRELYEAAKVDGAGAWSRFRSVTLPMLRPSLAVGLSLRTIWALKVFDLVYTLTRGGPSGGTRILNYYVYERTFSSLTFGYGAAAATLVTLVIFGAVFFYQRLVYSEVEYV